MALNKTQTIDRNSGSFVFNKEDVLKNSAKINKKKPLAENRKPGGLQLF